MDRETERFFDVVGRVLDMAEDMADEDARSSRLRRERRERRSRNTDSLIEALEDAHWDDGRITILKVAAEDRDLTCRELRRILSTFSWDDGRVRAVRICAPCVLDHENFHRTRRAFSWDSSYLRATRTFKRHR